MFEEPRETQEFFMGTSPKILPKVQLYKTRNIILHNSPENTPDDSVNFLGNRIFSFFDNRCVYLLSISKSENTDI